VNLAQRLVIFFHNWLIRLPIHSEAAVPCTGHLANGWDGQSLKKFNFGFGASVHGRVEIPERF
jgi:hypothetical protein